MHPFSHSFVSQNYDKITSQIKKENDDFIELAPKLQSIPIVESKEKLPISESKESILLRGNTDLSRSDLQTST